MTVTPLPRVSSESRRDRVANVLRDAITRGQLQPGHRLIEMELAAQLGTSRAPIREALRQLEQEGLVVSSPYRGCEVLGVSQDEIEQVLVPVRLTIERFAFERALPMLDENDLMFLQGLVDDMHIAADQEDPERLADADVRFHEHVIIRSGQPHCLQMWRAIQPRVRAYFRRDAPVYGKHHALAAQHEDLLVALRSGDAGAVRTAVEKHITTHQAFDE